MSAPTLEDLRRELGRIRPLERSDLDGLATKEDLMATKEELEGLFEEFERWVKEDLSQIIAERVNEVLEDA